MFRFNCCLVDICKLARKSVSKFKFARYVKSITKVAARLVKFKF